MTPRPSTPCLERVHDRALGQQAGRDVPREPLPLSLRKALDLIDYPDARRLQKDAVGTGKRIGIGIGSTLDSGTNNFGQARLINQFLPFSGNTEGGLVRMGVDGSVYAVTGGVAFGQGHETTVAQVVADMLGLTPEDIITHRGGDSALSAQTGFSGSYASQFAVTGIGAILNATKKLVREIQLVARRRLAPNPTRSSSRADSRASSVTRTGRYPSPRSQASCTSPPPTCRPPSPTRSAWSAARSTGRRSRSPTWRRSTGT